MGGGGGRQELVLSSTYLPLRWNSSTKMMEAEEVEESMGSITMLLGTMPAQEVVITFAKY